MTWTWKVLPPNLDSHAKYNDENCNQHLASEKGEASGKASRVRHLLAERKAAARI
jgi:hypothetical protein